MAQVRFRIFLSALLICGFALIPAFIQAQDAEETPQPATEINGLQVTLDVDSSHAGFSIDDLRAATEVIARRLEALEIAPFRVQILNQASIQVQFPGIEDPQTLINTLTQTAFLEFVDFSGLTEKIVQFDGLSIQTTGRAENADGQVNPLTGKPFATILTGASVKSARAEVASYDPSQWTIAFELTDEAAAIFGDYTGSHIGEPLAIVLDGRVLSIPVIQSRLDSQGVIVSNFTEQEAKQLAAQLRAGALPLPLVVAETATIETISLEK